MSGIAAARPSQSAALAANRRAVPTGTTGLGNAHQHRCASTTRRQRRAAADMNAAATLTLLACVLEVSCAFPFNADKRNLDSLARTGQLPENKRSLASLAKSGQLPDTLVQEKRMLDVLEEASDANSRAIQEQRSRVVQEIKNLAQSGLIKRQEIAEPDFRNEFKSDLRNILDQYLKKFGTTYDPEKVELFLTNMADEVFDNHGVVSLDHIRFLIETGYFQPELRDEADVKPVYGDLSPDDYIAKRFVASLARTGNVPFWHDGPRNVAKRYISSLLRQGRLPYGFQPTTESSSSPSPAQDGQKPKRSDAAYQNEEEFIPVMQGGRSLQSIIDDLVQEPAQKRYLGALSRSGWMPRGFASATSSSSSYRPSSDASTGGYGYGKRHLAALARLGLLRSFRSPYSFYRRNGRGYQCDASKRTTADADADWNVENIGRSFEEHGDGGPSAATEQTQADRLKSKRYLLLPAVDNILLRKQYPHLATNKI